MIKKPIGKYESPVIEVVHFDAEDIVTASGDNYMEWGWSDNKPLEDGIFG